MRILDLQSYEKLKINPVNTNEFDKIRICINHVFDKDLLKNHSILKTANNEYFMVFVCNSEFLNTKGSNDFEMIKDLVKLYCKKDGVSIIHIKEYDSNRRESSMVLVSMYDENGCYNSYHDLDIDEIYEAPSNIDVSSLKHFTSEALKQVVDDYYYEIIYKRLYENN